MGIVRVGIVRTDGERVLSPPAGRAAPRARGRSLAGVLCSFRGACRCAALRSCTCELLARRLSSCSCALCPSTAPVPVLSTAHRECMRGVGSVVHHWRFCMPLGPVSTFARTAWLRCCAVSLRSLSRLKMSDFGKETSQQANSCRRGQILTCPVDCMVASRGKHINVGDVAEEEEEIVYCNSNNRLSD